jgi:hypothetical protein
MLNLEYAESIPKCGYGKIHNCDICPYVTKSLFFMINHTKRHRLPLDSISCETIDLEKYYCKDCNFKTDLMVIFNQHIREHHRKDTDFVQDQTKNDTVIKNYICQQCSFETYSALQWIKHLDTPCLNIKEDFETVRIVSCGDEKWYRCEHCSFETKKATLLKGHQSAEHPPAEGERLCCFHCKYKAKTKKNLQQHINYKHSTVKAIRWFQCNESQFTSKDFFNLQTQENSCLAVESKFIPSSFHAFKTKYKKNLKCHRTYKLTIKNEQHELLKHS